MRSRIVLLVAVLCCAVASPAVAIRYRPPQYSPRLFTVRPDGTTKTHFERGERIVVLGEGFPKFAPAYVLFRQTTERLLASVRTTATGSFRSDVHVPLDAHLGAAVVRGATFGHISTVANITVVAGVARTIPTHDRDVAVLGVAGIALVAAGLLLSGFVWWRRRRAERPVDEDDADDEDDEDDETDAGSPVDRLRRAVEFWKSGPASGPAEVDPE